MARVEAGAELSEEEMVSAVMSLAAGKRKVSRGGPKRKWKVCPRCRSRVYRTGTNGLEADWKRHIRECGGIEK
jgi:hypothetical protein